LKFMPSEQLAHERFSTLSHMMERQADRIPDAPAILAPGRATLTFSGLHQHVRQIGRTLRSMGVRRHDRVALALPNGPEMPVAILAVQTLAACAPVNPALKTGELDRYFTDLRPDVLITQPGTDSSAHRVALSQKINVIELSPALDREAGLFVLAGKPRQARSDEEVNPSDVALLLPTSGTTSRPKIVPMSHAAICASAHAHATALALTESDRALNILPVFHGHGLIATVTASLAAGASVICTPGLEVANFFRWLVAFQPTWYSAVATMHQAILAQARRDRERPASARLRFVRSSSAPLPSRFFKELEQFFEAPLIEWYGMTEVAASPIACNPLPPRRRKPGSVGVPAALDVAIMDERGAVLPDGETGQVVIRGTNVMKAYDGDPAATEAAFEGNWFKTGDVGFFDQDKFLFLVGRVREMINRGGEKIAPAEVDDVLFEHPAVEDAVTFSVPHATLGEDIAAAVVLRPGALATANDLRQFARKRIAEFKVPRQVLIVEKIPKGPTGKVQRIEMAAKLGLANDTYVAPNFVAPRTKLEKALAQQWAEILQVDEIGIHDDFFACGGDSLLATHALGHVYDVTHIELDVSRFFEAPTIAEVARHLELSIQTQEARRSSSITRVSREGKVPTSIAQQRFWKLQQVVPDVPLFNVLYAVRLTSLCDAAILEQSLNEIVRRHEILRTTLAVIDGECVQIIAPQLTVPVTLHDLRKHPRAEKEATALELFQEEAAYSFDLAKGPLLRVRLVQLTKRDHLLLVSSHQVICDGWSLGVLLKELVVLYDAFAEGKSSPLLPLPIQFADFANWQRHYESYSEIAAQFGYWREQLNEPLPAMRFGKASSMRRIDAFRTARREWRLPRSLVQAVKRFSREESSTLFILLVAALMTLLHRSLGLDDVRVATNVANRYRPGTETLIGHLVNTVILRTNLSGDPSPREVVRRVRATASAVFAHQDIPFEEIARALESERGTKLSALTNVMILLQNAALRPAAGSGRRLRYEEANPDMLVPLVTVTSFDAIFVLKESQDGLVGTLVYKPHLFSTTATEHMLRDFEDVLECMISRPNQPISALRLSLNQHISGS
jgi:acyl-CoA synthetase (AMP-forming)/AMP-acid ligase II